MQIATVRRKRADKIRNSNTLFGHLLARIVVQKSLFGIHPSKVESFSNLRISHFRMLILLTTKTIVRLSGF